MLPSRYTSPVPGYKCANCGALTADGPTKHAQGCGNAGPYIVRDVAPFDRMTDKTSGVEATRLQIVAFHWFGADGAARAQVVADALNKYESEVKQ